MKEVSFKLYRFDELSEEAQDAVIERERDNIGYISAQNYSDDWQASLDEFEKLIGISVKYDVDYSGWGHSYSFEFDDPVYYNSECTIDAEEVNGRLLARFLDKIYYKIRSRKFIYFDCRKKILHCDRRKTRYSKIMWVENNCPLTGCIYDCSLLEPIYEWQKKWDMNISLYDLIDKCLEKFFSEWERDMSNCYEDDFVKEHIAANSDGDLYYEDGTLYEGPKLAV